MACPSNAHYEMSVEIIVCRSLGMNRGQVENVEFVESVECSFHEFHAVHAFHVFDLTI